MPHPTTEKQKSAPMSITDSCRSFAFLTQILLHFAESKMPSYSISQLELFSLARKVIDISRQIEQLETRIRSVQSNANWIEKCAKEMDILLDEDEKYVVNPIFKISFDGFHRRVLSSGFKVVF